MASNYFNLRRFNLTTTFKDISFSALMALYGSARRNLNQAIIDRLHNVYGVPFGGSFLFCTNYVIATLNGLVIEPESLRIEHDGATFSIRCHQLDKSINGRGLTTDSLFKIFLALNHHNHHNLQGNEE
jgi:hypothetical protein